MFDSAQTFISCPRPFQTGIAVEVPALSEVASSVKGAGSNSLLVRSKPPSACVWLPRAFSVERRCTDGTRGSIARQTMTCGAMRGIQSTTEAPGTPSPRRSRGGRRRFRMGTEENLPAVLPIDRGHAGGWSLLDCVLAVGRFKRLYAGRRLSRVAAPHG